jgi:ComEC/Rec2-related protein
LDWIKNVTFSQITSFIFIIASILALHIKTGLSYSILHIIVIFLLSCVVLGALFLLIIPIKMHVSTYFLLIFALSVVYASLCTTTFPYPYEKRIRLRLMLLSDPRIRGRTLQFIAKLKRTGIAWESQSDIEHRDRANSHFPHQKVLLNLPFMSVYPQRGDTVEVEGIFMDLPYEDIKEYALYLKSRGIHAIFEGSGRQFIVRKQPPIFSIVAVSNKLKSYICRVNDRLLLYPHSEFATALLTGNRDELPPHVIESFRLSGTMHILAVSGLHIGFLVFFFLLLFKILRLNQILSYIILIGVVVFYMVFIGDTPSVKRASFMVLCGIAMFLLDRDRNYLNVLAIAFNILWFMNPLMIINPGFLLSFAATFAILFLVPHVQSIFSTVLPRFLAMPLALTAGIQLYLLPIMLSFFGSFAYINIVANLPVVPLAGISLALEILTLLFYPLFLPLAIIFAEVNIVVVSTILRLADLFARVPPITVGWCPQFFIPIYFLLITVGVCFVFKRNGGLGAQREKQRVM